MEFSTSQKGNRVLLYLGYEYLYFRTIKGVLTWRCRQSRTNKCHAIIKTKDGEIVQQPTEHCHDSCPQKAIANAARSTMRHNIGIVSATPSSVIADVLSTLTDDVLAHMPKPSSLVRNLLNHRKVIYLPNPNTVSFNIPEKYAEVLLHDTGVNDPDRILVFGDRGLSLQLKNDTIIGDGTFDTVPSMFYQLYTWHAKVGNSYPPCIYVLLLKKDIDTYKRMFEIMKLLVPDLQPRKVFVDLEKAMMDAAISAFPEAEVKGSFFYLCQSLIRKVSSVGLRALYESDLDAKLMLKSLPALSFVPMNDVRRVFDDIAAAFPDDDCYNEVLSDFYTTYIEGVAGRGPRFPIIMWNHHGAALEGSPEATNCHEGFHNTLNSIFHCSRPSVWYLFDGLQRDLASHKSTLMTLEAGIPEVKKRKSEELPKLVADAVQRYNQIEDKLLYLRKLANLF